MSIRSLETGVIVILLLAGGTAFSADPVCPNEIDHWSKGPCAQVEVSENWAYIGDGSHITVVDISDPENPEDVGGVDLPGTVLDLEVNRPLIYVAGSGGQFHVVHEGYPNQPYLYATLDVSDSDLTGVTRMGNTCFVADGHTMYSIDVSSAMVPAVLDWSSQVITPLRVDMRGYYVVAAGNSAVSIVDATDVGDLSVAGQWNQGVINGTDVFVDGNYAYVSSGYSKLMVFDVNNVVDPDRVGVVDLPFGRPDSVVASGGYVYLGMPDYGDVGVHVVDATLPENPLYAFRQDTQGEPMGLAHDGENLYVADQSELSIFDNTNPPYLYDRGAVESASQPNDLAVSNGLLYIAEDNGGLRILDLGQTGHPMEVGRIATPGEALAVALSTDTKSNKYAYIADGYDLWGDGMGLRVIDVTDPSNPVESGFRNFNGQARAIAASWPYVCVGMTNISIFDVSDPANITSLGWVTDPGRSEDLDLCGSILYSANNTSGLVAIDISDVLNPYVIATASIGTVFRVQVWENILYVYTGEGIKIFNAGAPGDLTPLATIDVTYPRDVFAYENTALVADEVSGLYVYDISVPSAPMEIGTAPGLGRSARVAGYLDWAILADQRGGIQIFDRTWPCDAGLAGDCNGDGQVSIGEVQGAINMFLGAAPDCGVDADDNGTVSIGEVQTVINNFLGG